MSEWSEEDTMWRKDTAPTTTETETESGGGRR
jgi:hypothetical protein